MLIDPLACACWCCTPHTTPHTTPRTGSTTTTHTTHIHTHTHTHTTHTHTPHYTHTHHTPHSRRYGKGGIRRYCLTHSTAGWFCRVLQVGMLAEGDDLTIIERPNPGWHGALFRQKFILEDAIGSHACSLEARAGV
jgi:hypothetical protein